MAEYITDEQFNTVLEDMIYKIDNKQYEELVAMLEEMLEDAEKNDRYIDRTYIGTVKEKKKARYIEDIYKLMSDMTVKQIENIYTYVTNEHDEPNHEAQALEVIVNLSRQLQKEKDESDGE